jgi:hypothetical protein
MADSKSQSEVEVDVRLPHWSANPSAAFVVESVAGGEKAGHIDGPERMRVSGSDCLSRYGDLLFVADLGS